MNEKDIKIQVIDWLHKNEKHAVIVPEVTLGDSFYDRVRADVFALNGSISIYEIKSEKDTLDRLDNQIEKYTRYANKVSVIVDSKFLGKMTLPDSVGIYTIDNKKIEEIKEPKAQELSVDIYLKYWWGIEFKKALRGIPYASNLHLEAAISKFKELFTDEEIKNLTLIRLKERYCKESNIIKELIKNKEYDKLMPKRVFEKETKNIKVTPIVDMPKGVLMGLPHKDFLF